MDTIELRLLESWQPGARDDAEDFKALLSVETIPVSPSLTLCTNARASFAAPSLSGLVAVSR